MALYVFCLQYVQCSQHVEERYPTWSFPICITHWNTQHQHHQPQQQQQQRQLQLQPIPVTNTRWSPRSYLSRLIPHLTSSILPVTSRQLLLGTCMASRVSPNWTNCWMMLPTSSRRCSWDPARWRYRDPVWRRLAEVWSHIGVLTSSFRAIFNGEHLTWEPQGLGYPKP